MSSSTLTPSPYPSGTTSAFAAFIPAVGGSVRSGSTYRTQSWKKFIRRSPKQWQIKFTTVTLIVSSEGTTTESVFVPEPNLTLEELLNGPLFRVAGIFEIDEPRWADKHDEYIAETYL